MDMYLLLVTCLAIVIVVLGVSWWKWHAFISLTVASLFLAIMSGLSMDKIVGAYETGVGSVLGHLVGILALGTILGKMMSDSGAGMQVAEFFIRFFGIKKLPWAMLFAGFIIGIPVFFEVGIVILLPLVISIHKTTRQNILLIALPVIAGLSIVHGLVPPHPGAMTAIGIYNADLGRVLLYSLVIALPAAIVAGPVFAKWVHKRVIPEGEPELIPVIALLISCFAAFYLLGMRQGMKKNVIKKLVEESLLPVGSIILIIGAGGGFKQILIDSGVGTSIAQMSEQLSLSPIVLAFMVAGLIRIATGSATVALTTAAGIVSPIIVHMSGVNLELLVIATGAGSLMFSHVNDAGFWLVKEYLGLTVKETFKTWTVLETLLSFIAFGGVLLFDIFI